MNGPFPATGKSDVEDYFAPPYFEWWNAQPVRPSVAAITSVLPAPARHLHKVSAIQAGSGKAMARAIIQAVR